MSITAMISFRRLKAKQMKFYSILFIALLIFFGVAYVFSNDISDQEFSIAEETPLDPEEVESCKVYSNLEDTSVSRGVLEVILKDGVTEEELVAGLQSTGLKFEMELEGGFDLTQDPTAILDIYIPEREEESYIEELRKTGLFTCVGYKIALIPSMPGPY